MADKHLSIALLEAIHRGEKRPSDLAAAAMAHLFDLCSICRKAFDQWLLEAGEMSPPHELSRYDPAFDRIRARLRGEEELTTASRARLDLPSARERLGELLSLPPHARFGRVEERPDRYFGPVLGEMLLDEATKRLPGQPGEACSLAALARAVVQHHSADLYTTEVYARALAQQGNALRAQGKLRRAAEMIETARFMLRTQRGGDRLTQAEIDRCEGTLRRAQRRFDEAEILLSRAAISYGLEGRSEEAAKTLVSLAITLEHSGDFLRANDLVDQAIEEFEQRGNQRLLLMARHNQIYYQMKLGDVDVARRRFEESAELYDEFGDALLQIRRHWLDANLSRAEGRLSRAEKGYREVSDAFMARGMGYDAALAALDLAVVYAEQGRTTEIKKVAEEIVPIFESQDVHREAAAALMLFRDAVRAEQVTLGYVVELSRYLQRARLDPSLQFQIPT